MKTKYFQRITIVLLIYSFIVGLFFENVSESQAQSSQNWLDPINLSNAGSSTSPEMVIDLEGTIHVIWIDEFDGYKYVKSTNGVDWTSPVIAQFPFLPEDDSRPVFLPDESGRIYAFWRDENNAFYYSVTSSSDLSSGWTNRTELADLVLNFDVVTDSQGRLHIGYVRNVDAEEHPAGVYYLQFNGNNWSDSSTLYTSQHFRSLEPDDANIHLSVSEKEGLETVYMVWDDRPQKRILMSKSTDTGLNWVESWEAIVPEADLGYSVPFNVEVSTLNEGLLMMWQVGDPGIRCTQYSKWSTDGGESWDTPIKLFDEFTVCPEKSEFISIDPNYLTVLFNVNGDLSIIAWNGTEWSEPEIQSGLSAVINPRTFDTVTFDCQQVSSINSILFVIGCNQRGEGDIWFISREIDPLENLFPSPSAWSSLSEVTIIPNKILSLTFVTDQENSTHVLWVETSASGTDQVEPKIQYARESEGGWLKPTSVITDLNGLPTQLSLAIDSEQRLLLVWISENTGDLLFSWANSNRANIPLEWTEPIILPSPSKLNASPDILVDASGQIVVVYAITINENRGLYLTRSNDLGKTWSAPIKVFDAISSDWNGIDQPQIALTGDGTLHLLFHQVSALGSLHTEGLYYSQSKDGGLTWSPAEKVGEQLIRWSELISYGEQIVHRVWQQVDKSTVTTFHQVSRDGGQTWDAPYKISSIAATAPEPTLSIGQAGNLHLMQFIVEDSKIFQEWEWVDARWRSLETRKVNFEGQYSPVSISSGVTTNGMIQVLLLLERSDLNGEFESILFNTHRSLNITDVTQNPSIASIAIPVATVTPTINSAAQLDPTPLSPLVEPLQSTSSRIKNVIGLILVISITILILVFVLPRKKKPLE